jgi:hypothetical protein
VHDMSVKYPGVQRIVVICSGMIKMLIC